MRRTKGEIGREQLRGLMQRIVDSAPEKALQITPRQALLLDHLIGHGPSPAGDIAKAEGLSIGNIGESLIYMARRGLVERSSGGLRANGVLWSVTELGRQAAITPQSWAMEG